MMKQEFKEKEFENFKDYLKIKENPGKIEKEFIEKTNKYLNLIKWIPGIKMIGIGNSISMNCANKDSDIDLFIVTSNKRIWIVRTVITIIFQILLVRKNKKYHASRFCLSFFSTTDGLNFGEFAIENDVYLYFWIIYFKPIIDFDETYNLFIEKNSNWANFGDYKNMFYENKSYIKIKGKSLGNKNKFLDFIENIIKKVFLKKTLRTYKKIGKPFGIVINNNMLKFHNGDIRKEIKEKLTKK